MNCRFALVAVAISFLFFISVHANSKEKRQTHALVEVDNPDDVITVLSSLVQNLMQASSMEHYDKRNLDLGFSRGFSGSQAAKHLMGLAAANFAGGPGRRRKRSDKQEVQVQQQP